MITLVTKQTSPSKKENTFQMTFEKCSHAVL